jgi:hypothetical protein
MSIIKVHVLNFHSIVSHLEIALENTSTTPHSYYIINRWDEPRDSWSKYDYFNYYIAHASSIYSFDIKADPDDITDRWINYYEKTYDDASILGKNCAVAAQWFLTEFAGIPKPGLSNVSWNHLSFGFIWPSFIPCPVTLSGRVMSNAKFYIEAMNNPEAAAKYSRLFLYTSIALASLAFSASIFALIVATTVLSGGIAAIATTACVSTGIASTYGIFKARNTLQAKNVTDELHEIDKQPYSSNDELLIDNDRQMQCDR